ncbi:uncharacterized protein LOC122048691 [Zingiber officinale]|uniref:uncharacterized protein LOC122048691 n=1 Tax=Zingiber officinale TaxID=94328 RepID=UPI001C4C3C4E|nr:uncharacterized protein LOC122048691 [Zingiber officinale]
MNQKPPNLQDKTKETTGRSKDINGKRFAAYSSSGTPQNVSPTLPNPYLHKGMHLPFPSSCRCREPSPNRYRASGKWSKVSATGRDILGEIVGVEPTPGRNDGELGSKAAETGRKKRSDVAQDFGTAEERISVSERLRPLDAKEGSLFIFKRWRWGACFEGSAATEHKGEGAFFSPPPSIGGGLAASPLLLSSRLQRSSVAASHLTHNLHATSPPPLAGLLSPSPHATATSGGRRSQQAPPTSRPAGAAASGGCQGFLQRLPAPPAIASDGCSRPRRAPRLPPTAVGAPPTAAGAPRCYYRLQRLRILPPTPPAAADIALQRLPPPASPATATAVAASGVHCHSRRQLLAAVVTLRASAV